MGKFVKVITLCMLLCGCSVFMAMHGKPDANLGIVNIGQDRSVIIANLGQPSKTVMVNGKKTDTFELQQGNAPSGGRALAHGALDVLTFGGWEIIGTPVEGMQGKSFFLTLEYDEKDKVTKVNTTDKP